MAAMHHGGQLRQATTLLCSGACCCCSAQYPGQHVVSHIFVTLNSAAHCKLQVAGLVVWFGTLAGYYALFVPMLYGAAWQASAIVLYSAASAVVFCTYLLVRCAHALFMAHAACGLDCCGDAVWLAACSLTDPSDDSSDGPLYCDHCQVK